MKKTPPSASGKQRILAAAKSLLAEGNTNPSMMDVAQKSGLSKSALYYFFKNKSDLFSELAYEQSQYFQENIQKIIAEKKDPEETMKKMLLFSLSYLQKEQPFSLFLFEQILTKSPKMLEGIVQERRKVVALFESVLNQGIASGIFRKKSPQKSSRLLVGMLDFFALASILSSGQDSRHCACPHDLCLHFLSLLKV